VDVVVPFHGDRAELDELAARMARLELGERDSLLVVDNTPGEDGREAAVPLLHAAERETPAYARNRGAARGEAEWIVFLDADVAPSPGLLDRYFSPAPGERTALLSGGITDEPVPRGGPPAARYVHLRELMSQEDTLRIGRWAFPKTANVACRRAAFEQLGGFRDELRGGEDADLTYRMSEAGWALERREEASVVHLSRHTVRGFVRQKLVHGSGLAWVERHYPGAAPARRMPGLLWWGVRTAVRGLGRAVRTRDRDEALWAVFEPLEVITHELGRRLPNERPPRPGR